MDEFSSVSALRGCHSIAVSACQRLKYLCPSPIAIAAVGMSSITCRLLWDVNSHAKCAPQHFPAGGKNRVPSSFGWKNRNSWCGGVIERLYMEGGLIVKWRTTKEVKTL